MTRTPSPLLITTTMTIGTIYLIRSLLNGSHKIGITQNWTRRSRELEVGSKATEVLVESVVLPQALELKLHRRFKKERIPQSEYFVLSAAQVEEVKALITQEAEKLKGDQADLHITLARLVYEQESLPAGKVSSHAAQIDQLKRQLDPEYRRQAEQAEEIARQRRAEREARRERDAAIGRARIEEAKAKQRELAEKSLANDRRTVALPLADAFREKSVELVVGTALTAFHVAGIIAVASLFATGATDCRPGYRLNASMEACQSSDAIRSTALPIGLLLGIGTAVGAVNSMIKREKREAQERLDRSAVAPPVSSTLQATQQPATPQATAMQQGSIALGGLQQTPISFCR